MRTLAQPIKDAYQSACIEAGLDEEDRQITDAILLALEERTAALDLSIEGQLAITKELLGELLLRLHQKKLRLDLEGAAQDGRI